MLPELLGRLLGREPAAERGVSREPSESAVDGRERGEKILINVGVEVQQEDRTLQRLVVLIFRIVRILRILRI